MLIISTCCRSKVFLNIWVVLTELIIVTLTIIAGLEMIIVVCHFRIDIAVSFGILQFLYFSCCCFPHVCLHLQTAFADFCMQPSDNLLKPLPKGILKKAAVYYTQCSGESPFASTIDDVVDNLNKFNVTFTDANGQLPSAQLAQAQQCINHINSKVSGRK